MYKQFLSKIALFHHALLDLRYFGVHFESIIQILPQQPKYIFSLELDRKQEEQKVQEIGNAIPYSRLSVTQVETPDPDNMTLTNSNVNIQDSLGCSNSENQLTEPSQISNEIQDWTQIMEEKSNDRITKMRIEMDNKFEMIPKEIKNNKIASTANKPQIRNK